MYLKGNNVNFRACMNRINHIYFSDLHKGKNNNLVESRIAKPKTAKHYPHVASCLEKKKLRCKLFPLFDLN